jgi:hypothetical protein
MKSIIETTETRADLRHSHSSIIVGYTVSRDIRCSVLEILISPHGNRPTYVSKLYRRLAVEDVLDDTECLKNIERRWSNFSTDIQACLVVDENLAVYFIELADVH